MYHYFKKIDIDPELIKATLAVLMVIVVVGALVLAVILVLGSTAGCVPATTGGHIQKAERYTIRNKYGDLKGYIERDTLCPRRIVIRNIYGDRIGEFEITE